VNIQPPATKGAQAVSVTGIPAVALRAAARIALDEIDAASPGRDESVHIGTSRR